MLTNEDWPSLAWTITTKHQILMTGDSRRGKSIWPTAHHLRGCSIVPVYTVQCRILLPNHKVAVSLLKRIALLMGPWPTPRITQGNIRLESSKCLETWQSAPVKYSMVSHGHTILPTKVGNTYSAYFSFDLRGVIVEGQPVTQIPKKYPVTFCHTLIRHFTL